MTTLTHVHPWPMLILTEPEKLPTSGTPPRKLRFFYACPLPYPITVGRAANTIRVRPKYARRLVAVLSLPAPSIPVASTFVETIP